MASLTNINSISCSDIGAVDGISAASISKFDNIDFCVSPTPTPTSGGSSPTPTPTNTPTPTPTPSPCSSDCCPASLCYDRSDCRNACSCNDIRSVYLSRICSTDPCTLAYATGIYEEDTCTTAATSGYYSDGNDCYLWNGSTLTLQGSC